MTSKTPLIFIPGLFGCMGNEIVSGTGSWHFGLSRYTGKRLIKQLEKNGYTLEKDLFILFYDWRKKTTELALSDLSHLIDKVKALTHTNHIDLLCHGTGGLIARYFCQHGSYDGCVKNLILVGTPHLGFVPAFSYLSGGLLPFSCMCEPDFLSLNINLYVQFTKHLNHQYPDSLLYHFPALGDFIPCDGYGPYLFYYYKNQPQFIPYDQMVTKNDFLDDLNTDAHLLKDHGIHTVLIAGTGEATCEHLEIVPACEMDAWHDGKVIHCLQTLEGDSCITVKSALGIDGDQYTFKSDYGELILQTASLLPSLI